MNRSNGNKIANGIFILEVSSLFMAKFRKHIGIICIFIHEVKLHSLREILKTG
jgi:hypothetical protein